MSKDSRLAQLNVWAVEQLEKLSIKIPAAEQLIAASDDASFRRYFRFQNALSDFIFVDAPPNQEEIGPFVYVAKLLTEHSVHAPEVHAIDEDLGFMMLSDLGNLLYLEVLERNVSAREFTQENLQPETPSDANLYQEALNALVSMQTIDAVLPEYNADLLENEMNLFPDWLLEKLLGFPLSKEEKGLLDDVFDLMKANALEQPQVFVHRDYHSRNLMVVDHNSPGIIDFQDAVLGPVTYDLASLLRDCYIALPPGDLTFWVDECRQQMMSRGVLQDVDAHIFRRWFDLMGFQRHLKCSGIFARLYLRDGKGRYLGDIPRVVNYLIEVSEQYDELRDFGDWLSALVVPRLQEEIFVR